jgi:hypothetical protein
MPEGLMPDTKIDVPRFSVRKDKVYVIVLLPSVGCDPAKPEKKEAVWVGRAHHVYPDGEGVDAQTGQKRRPVFVTCSEQKDCPGCELAKRDPARVKSSYERKARKGGALVAVLAEKDDRGDARWQARGEVLPWTFGRDKLRLLQRVQNDLLDLRGDGVAEEKIPTLLCGVPLRVRLAEEPEMYQRLEIQRFPDFPSERWGLKNPEMRERVKDGLRAAQEGETLQQFVRPLPNDEMRAKLASILRATDFDPGELERESGAAAGAGRPAREAAERAAAEADKFADSFGDPGPPAESEAVGGAGRAKRDDPLDDLFGD